MNYYLEGLNAPIFSYTQEDVYPNCTVYQEVTNFMTFRDGYGATVTIDCDGNLTYKRGFEVIHAINLRDLTENSIVYQKGDYFEKHNLYGSGEPYIFRYTSRERVDGGVYYYGVIPFINCLPYSEDGTTVFISAASDDYTVRYGDGEITINGRDLANYCSYIHKHKTLFLRHVYNNKEKLPVFGYNAIRPTHSQSEELESHYINVRLNIAEYYDTVYPYAVLNKVTGILTLYADSYPDTSNPCMSIDVHGLVLSDLLYAEVKRAYCVGNTPIFSYSSSDDFWSYKFRYRDVVWYVDGYQEYNGCDIITVRGTTEFKTQNTYDFHKYEIAIAGDLKTPDQCYETAASPI